MLIIARPGMKSGVWIGSRHQVDPLWSSLKICSDCYIATHLEKSKVPPSFEKYKMSSVEVKVQ